MSFRGFSREPRTRGVGPGLIRTEDALEYLDEIRGFWLLIPAGFVCDGASVPRFGWPLLRAGFLELLPCGIAHDYLYRTDAVIRFGGRRAPATSAPVPGRAFADRTMAEAMGTRRGVSAMDQRLARAALALGGWTAWHKRAVGWRG